MFVNRKRTLLVALGALLASSTAVAVLTLQTDAGALSNSAASGSAPDTLPEELTGNLELPGHVDEALAFLHSPAGESARYLQAANLTSGDEPPAGLEEKAEELVENISALSDVVEATQGSAAPRSLAGGSSAGGQYSFGQRQLIALAGGSSLSGLQQSPSPGTSQPGGSQPDASEPGPSQPGATTPQDPLTDFDSLQPDDSNSQRPDPVPGTDPQDGGCVALTGCGSLDDPPGTIPGGDAPAVEPPPTATVPEPGSLGLLGFGLMLVALMGRRRRAPF